MADLTIRRGSHQIGGAVQEHILSVLSPGERDAMEGEMDACVLVGQADVGRARREVPERAAGYHE